MLLHALAPSCSGSGGHRHLHIYYAVLDNTLGTENTNEYKNS